MRGIVITSGKAKRAMDSSKLLSPPPLLIHIPLFLPLGMRLLRDSAPLPAGLYACNHPCCSAAHFFPYACLFIYLARCMCMFTSLPSGGVVFLAQRCNVPSNAAVAALRANYSSSLADSLFGVLAVFMGRC